MYGLISLVFLAAILDWLAVFKQWQRVKMITKPVVILVLMLWFYAMTGLQGAAVIFMLALVFSLVGDIWLMLPGNYFLLGLISFLLAHMAYLVAFTPTWPSSPVIWNILGIMLVLVGVIFFTRIRVGIIHTFGANKLMVMSGVYGIFLTLMTVSAVATLTRPDWLPAHAIQAAAGGILFFVSDVLLAFDRFVKPVRYGRLSVRVTYHLGQILLISGAAQHLTR